MKKQLSLILCIATLVPLFAQNIGDRVYREVTVNGETFTKWSTLASITEYDEKGNWTQIKVGQNIFAQKFDDKGNLTYLKNRDGEGNIYNEYDRKENLIHVRSDAGDKFESWYEYDSDGNKKSKLTKFSNGSETQTWYDVNGNEIHVKTSSGLETWTEYDGRGNPVHCKGNGKSEWWREYDKHGNITCHKNSYGLVDSYENKYDSKGNLIYTNENSNNGKYTIETWYDDHGNSTHIKRWSGEEWNAYAYDSHGSITFRYNRSSLGEYFYWTDYTYWPNGKIKTKIEYSAK